MNPSNPKSRRHREVRPAPEALETRSLLTGGAGSTFAVLPGVVAKTGDLTAVKFTIDPKDFHLPAGKMSLGIDVAPDPTSGLTPQIVGVVSSEGRLVPTSRSIYDRKLSSPQATPGKPTSAVLTTVKLDPAKPTAPVSYVVDVRGLSGTTGKFLLGFYLPGDANGDGKVDQTDITAIKAAMGAVGGSSKYSFDADANRNGRVSATDLRTAMMNQGVSTDISPVVSANLDANGMLDVTQRTTRNPSATFSGTASPGASVKFTEVNGLVKPVSTTVNATGSYSITVPLAVGSNTFQVATADSFGQTISGTLSPVNYSNNPPVTAASQAALASQATPAVTVKKS
jgi:hypothetical protein